MVTSMGRLRLAGGVLSNGAMGRAIHRLAHEGWTVDPLNPLLRWAQGESGGGVTPTKGFRGGGVTPPKAFAQYKFSRG